VALRERDLRAPVVAAHLPGTIRPAASCTDAEAGVPGIVLLGDGSAARAARSAIEQLLATETGSRAREILRSGALREPLTIELNQHGDNFTRYRAPGGELGETIAFDPSTLSLVETERGRLAATPETILAHELGHAVFKLRSEEDVIQEIENPVRRELGLPARVRF